MSELDWEKIGLIFSPQKHSSLPWMQEFAQAPSTIVFDDFVRVYFSTRAKPINGKYVSQSGFVDLDRKDLSRIKRISKQPILPLGDLGTFDEFGIYPVSIFQIDKKEFHCYYAGWTRCESVPFNVAIGKAISQDGGVSFKRIGQGPILSYSLEEPFILSGPKIRRFNNKWYLFYIAGREWILDDGKPEPIYKIRMAESEDGKHWEKYNKDLIKSKFDNEAQASPDVFFHEGRYHMFYSYRHGRNYRTGPLGYRIGYANSNDLIHWERNDEKVGISLSQTGWDDESISYPNVFSLDGEIYMFYLGNGVGKEGFGLAKLKSALK